MDIPDDVDERLRRAARPDHAAVDRVKRGALSSVGRPSRGRAVPLAGLLVCLLALAVWWMERSTTVAITITWEGGGDAMAVQAPDGTTWIVGGRASPDYLPPGTCVIIAAGGTQ